VWDEAATMTPVESARDVVLLWYAQSEDEIPTDLLEDLVTRIEAYAKGARKQLPDPPAAPSLAWWERILLELGTA
jgi:hypothetical protein